MILTLLQIAALFGMLGLLSFGGGNAIIADMQFATVQTHAWMTDKEFLDIFAISRATPGPGMLVVALIGLKAAGIAGAAVAFVAIFAPPFLLIHTTARAWLRARSKAWFAVAERGLAPVAIGLVFAGGVSLLQSAEPGVLCLAITAVSTVLLAFTETHPLLVMAGGAGLVLAVT